MSTNHTPGPWGFDQEDDNSTDFWVFQANGPARIAVEVSERDAALIAAAPEMFAALDAIFGIALDGKPHFHSADLIRAVGKERFDAARAALAKATGA